jgi:type 1 glutamine amidotransferase
MIARGLLLSTLSLALMAPAGSALAQKSNPGAATVLILSGGQRQHHGYRDQALYLSKLLEDTGRLSVTIAEDAALLESPALKKYDILIINADRRDPEFKLTAAQQDAIFRFVRSGHGYVSIHGADNTPNDLTDEQTTNWKELLGGIYSHKGQPDGKAILGDYRIHIADTSHPITQGLSDFDLHDELYSNMQMLPKVKPLVTLDREGVTWPVAWTSTYGDGRVFHTSLCHRGWKDSDEKDPLRNSNVSRLIVQGVEWVAEGVKKEK